MTLWHIDDFTELADQVPRPHPWQIIGVLPTRADYLQYGNIVYRQAFCYTVSAGPTEMWCPMESIEGRFAPPELIATVLNVVFTAVGAHQLHDGDNMIVPLGTINEATPDTVDYLDGIFWIGTPDEDPDHIRYHCYQSPNTWVLPVRWSSPLGFPDP